MKLALEAVDRAYDKLARAIRDKTSPDDAYIEIGMAHHYLKQALAKQEGQSNFCPNCEALARELKTAKQEQGEPVAWIEHHKGGDNLNWEEVNHPYAKATPLYTTPQQRKPLTFEQVEACFQDGGIWGVDGKHLGTTAQGLHDFARAIEAAHGIKE